MSAVNNGVSTDPNLNDGDAAWMIAATALVYMMTPALAFFYGGLVHQKNIVNTLYLSFVVMGLVTTQWILFGYSLAFQPNMIGIGGGDWTSLGSGLPNLGLNTSALSPTYPQLIHVMYQSAFAVITPALISGAVVGRMKLSAYIIFIVVWSTICYDIEVHWIWSTNGWLAQYGAIDFAGGYVVEISSGVSALVASWVLGPRADYNPREIVKPAHVPLTVMGAGLIWVGWIGFNGGSANAANGVAGLAVVNTNGAAASGLLAWTLMDALTGHPSLVGACLGSIVGLVAITPAAGFVAPGWGVFIGFVGSLISYGGMKVKHWLHADDTLDVFLAHGLGGMSGHFMLGLFAQAVYNPAGKDGAFYGNPIQLWYQIAGILVTVAYSGGITAGILIVLKYTIGIRLPAEIESMGLDEAIHDETWMITVAATDEDGNKTYNSIELMQAAAQKSLSGDDTTPTDSDIDNNHNNNTEHTDTQTQRHDSIPHAVNLDALNGMDDIDLHPPPMQERQATADAQKPKRSQLAVPFSTLVPRQPSSRSPSTERTRINAHRSQSTQRGTARSTSRGRSRQVPLNQLNLSQAVAQLVADMALPGTSYDIGISRSC